MNQISKEIEDVLRYIGLLENIACILCVVIIILGIYFQIP